MTDEVLTDAQFVDGNEQADGKDAVFDIEPEDRMRAELYDFLAALLVRPPDAELLKKVGALNGDDTELGKAINVLARIARASSAASVEREFHALFIGLGRGELLPYASYYMTGFLNEKPLATLRQQLPEFRITRAPDVFEPEDQIASLCEVMAVLITGRFGQPASLARQGEFFNRHIGTWAEHFFSDLERAKNAVFFAPVGTTGRLFMNIEREAFRMTAG